MTTFEEAITGTASSRLAPDSETVLASVGRSAGIVFPKCLVVLALWAALFAPERERVALYSPKLVKQYGPGTVR